MKIIHCLNQYMPLAMAGTEIYTHTLATIQKGNGHEVAVVTPHIDHYRPGQINEHYIYDAIDVYQYLETGDPTDREVHYGKQKPLGLENFKKLITSLQPDIIHFHELNRSIGLTVEHVKIAKEYGAKTFLTMHLSFYTCNTNTLVRDGNTICDGVIRGHTCTKCSYKTLFKLPPSFAMPLEKISYLSKVSGLTNVIKTGEIKTLLMVPLVIERIKNELEMLTLYLDQFVSYAKWYENILLKNGVPANKITVVPAALVTTKAIETTTIFKQSAKPVKIVFIGRIQQQKGIHLIIEAIKKFSANEVQIDLYGKEEDTDYYKQCIKDSEQTNNIHWKGSINRSEVVACLSNYDMLCLASTFSEMSPLVIQEAFAAGIPVLASKVYGNMEQINHKYNGLLFDFNSSASLAEQIKLVVDNPSLILEMRKNLALPLSFEEINNAYLRIYDRC